MPSSPSAPELLHAVLAMQLGLISLEDAQAALAACQGSSGKRLRQALLESHRLSATQDELVAKLVEAYLSANKSDAQRSLELLRQTPSGAEALEKLAGHRYEATVSFDGSKTTGRKSGAIARPGISITSAGERFRALKLHAAGGMGEVHLARDEQLNRDVALKQLQEKFADDPHKRQRFVLEGEVTGSLEHPGIVPVYALGMDAHGRPFYAMRFVRGESLRNAVQRWHKSTPVAVRYRRDALELRRLLTRFMSVCQAIEYAHSRGVIHRDIKPANVMLGKHGETYVVDWGMARIAGETSADPVQNSEGPIAPAYLSGSSETQMGAIMGTPAYMSPEQASGDSRAVGVPADVYSLGATLYYLLVGRAPFAVEDASPMAFIKMIVERQFTPPRKAVPQIPRELEAICLRAMATAPGDRYHSAEALADDVERWLADERVHACQPTLVERLARWGRAHRTAVVAGGVGLALAAIVATLAALAINEARQREEALADENYALAESEREARAEADQRFLEARETVDAWLTGFSEALRHYPGLAPFRTAMLERAATEYEAFAAEESDNPVLQLERGRTLVRLGDLRRALAQPDKAQEAYRRAIAVFGEMSSLDDRPNESAIAWADAQGRLAMAFRDVIDDEAAEQAFVAARDRLEPIAAQRRAAGAAEADAALAVIEINLGSLLLGLGPQRRDDAQQAFADAARRLERLLASEPSQLQNRSNLAAATLGLGQVLMLRGDAAAAARRFSDAVQFYRAAVELDPADPVPLERKAMSLLYLASAEQQRGRYPEEEAAYEEAIADYLRLKTALPDVIANVENLALAQIYHGQALRDRESAAADAQVQYAAAKETLGQLAEAYPTMPRFRQEFAIAADGLADAHVALDQIDAALAESAAAIETLRSLVEAFPATAEYRAGLAVALCHEGQALSRRGDAAADERFAEAAELLDELIAGDETAPNFRYAAALVAARRGDALFAAGAHAEATPHFASSADHWRRLTDLSDDAAYADLAAWFFATCPDEAIRDWPHALSAAKEALVAAPTNHRYRATAALAMLRSGDAAGALDVLGLDPAALATADGRSLLVGALALHALRRPAEARQYLQLGGEWVDARLPGDWDLMRLLAECQRVVGSGLPSSPAESASGQQNPDTQSRQLPLPAEER